MNDQDLLAEIDNLHIAIWGQQVRADTIAVGVAARAVLGQFPHAVWLEYTVDMENPVDLRDVLDADEKSVFEDNGLMVAIRVHQLPVTPHRTLGEVLRGADDHNGLCLAPETMDRIITYRGRYNSSVLINLATAAELV